MGKATSFFDGLCETAIILIDIIYDEPVGAVPVPQCKGAAF